MFPPNLTRKVARVNIVSRKTGVIHAILLALRIPCALSFLSLVRPLDAPIPRRAIYPTMKSSVTQSTTLKRNTYAADMCKVPFPFSSGMSAAKPGFVRLRVLPPRTTLLWFITYA
jgi:hypothetical protein